MDWIVHAYRELGSFERGYVTAVAVVAVLLIAVELLVFLLRRRRGCKGILIPCPDGSIFITSGAVADMVASVAEAHPHASLCRASLFDAPDGRHTLKLRMALESPDASLPEVASRLKSDIFAAVENNLGVTTLASIDITLRRVSGARGAAKEPAASASAASGRAPPDADDSGIWY